MNNNIKRVLSVLLMVVVLVGNVSSVKAESKTKHSINEIIMYCNSSLYDEYSGKYISKMLDENGNAFNVYTDNCVSDQWFVAVVDTYGV